MNPVLFNQLIVLALIIAIALLVVGVMRSKAIETPWWVPDVRTFVSCFLVVSVVILIFVLVKNPIKDADDITKGAIGALLTVGFATIINFWFSSTKGSSDKDETIKSLSAAPTEPPAPVAPAPAPIPPADKLAP